MEARPLAVGLFRILGASLALAACGGESGNPPAAAGPVASPVADARTFHSMEDFLGGYWNRPIPAQGAAPAEWTTLDASLAPSQCGTCHVPQYEDWQTAIHSKAYSPGLAGQLVSQEANNFRFVRSCMVCHGPLSEQQAKLLLPEGGYGTNPDSVGRRHATRRSRAVRVLRRLEVLCRVPSICFAGTEWKVTPEHV